MKRFDRKQIYMLVPLIFVRIKTHLSGQTKTHYKKIQVYIVAGKKCIFLSKKIKLKYHAEININKFVQSLKCHT